MNFQIYLQFTPLKFSRPQIPQICAVFSVIACNFRTFAVWPLVAVGQERTGAGGKCGGKFLWWNFWANFKGKVLSFSIELLAEQKFRFAAQSQSLNVKFAAYNLTVRNCSVAQLFLLFWGDQL